ncbi:hypothetical protein JG688_00007008 [Phytophthora aleatoria]|uniref:Uncharacterized protein n=1 Tax=Phytophthora aleatoria TaxID=2496075 RepID=A0A8J5M727_9STRA|nr:hypothetical protein JG688_00007008 [Phytophthora aleatoria]
MTAVECDANPDKLEVLNSVCEETETEIGFYDDHDEWIRAIREDKETGDAPADDDSGDELIRGEDLGFAPLAGEECDDGQPLAGDTVTRSRIANRFWRNYIVNTVVNCNAELSQNEAAAVSTAATVATANEVSAATTLW